MKATIKACLNVIANHEADINLFKDIKWLTQKLNGLNYALDRVSISEEDAIVFETNVNLFLEKIQSNPSNEEIRIAIKILTKQIDLLTGHTPLQIP